MAAAVTDVRARRLPNRLTAPLAAIALCGFALAAVAGEASFRLGGLLAGTAIFAGPWMATWLVSPPSIGFGDVKLSAGLGLYLGWLGPGVSLAALVVAVLVAGAVAGAVIGIDHRRGRSTSTLPFGPALVIGAALAATVEVATNGPPR